MEKPMKKNQKFEKLKALRKKYYLSTAEIAQLLGISSSSYSSRENGRTPLSYYDIVTILWALNIKSKKHNITLTFEDVFLNTETVIEEKNTEPQEDLLKEDDETKLKYRRWFETLPADIQQKEFVRLLVKWY